MHSEKKYNFFILLIVILIFSACSSALYKPNPSNIDSKANIEDIIAGRKLYIKKCSSCHALVLPEKHDPEQWKILVSKMEQRAKLNEGDDKLILNYLTKGKSSN